ncbi:unnamed protein product [Vicia faba]|uniref:Uncharacterized protein n=1 Tax=Vicia faba TaxID=3906 RepID=A0AAV0Z1E2_VICFA|nr:unnamed protein product [Vicia faba]
MLFEIALTVNPLAFEGFGEVYEPVLRLSLAGFRHPSLVEGTTLWIQAGSLGGVTVNHVRSDLSLQIRTHKRRILPMALCESALYPGILTQQDPRNRIRVFFSLFRWGKAKREDFRKKASSADDLEVGRQGGQGKTETTDTEPGLDHRIDTLWLVSMPASLRSIKGAVP